MRNTTGQSLMVGPTVCYVESIRSAKLSTGKWEWNSVVKIMESLVMNNDRVALNRIPINWPKSPEANHQDHHRLTSAHRPDNPEVTLPSSLFSESTSIFRCVFSFNSMFSMFFFAFKTFRHQPNDCLSLSNHTTIEFIIVPHSLNVSHSGAHITLSFTKKITIQIS